ncbi:MAG: thioredoxin family protein [Nitrospirae bacterium]|nr:thioredoxin family protein [Nitrospirota bacterium]
MKAKVERFSILFSLIAVIVFGGCSNAAGIDDVLNKAKKEGKIVMLELGSVGCIPCEQMKPVMEKLRTNYKGKIEVIFVDIRKDGENGRRFGVTMIPTQVFLDKAGKELHRHVGFYGYEEIVPVLKKAGI